MLDSHTTFKWSFFSYNQIFCCFSFALPEYTLFFKPRTTLGFLSVLLKLESVYSRLERKSPLDTVHSNVCCNILFKKFKKLSIHQRRAVLYSQYISINNTKLSFKTIYFLHLSRNWWCNFITIFFRQSIIRDVAISPG